MPSHATETESRREESGQRACCALPGDQEMENAPARKPARPKRQAAEKAGVERRWRSVARREVVAEEKTFGELGMASVNSPAAAAWVGEACRIGAAGGDEEGEWWWWTLSTARGEQGRRGDERARAGGRWAATEVEKKVRRGADGWGPFHAGTHGGTPRRQKWQIVKKLPLSSGKLLSANLRGAFG
uniref:DUF834 domain-containing protein n=1 Tax=Oryza rufipogon TaxID=4529 RepID=A0A0E0NTI1_ORYRU